MIGCLLKEVGEEDGSFRNVEPIGTKGLELFGRLFLPSGGTTRPFLGYRRCWQCHREKWRRPRALAVDPWYDPNADTTHECELQTATATAECRMQNAEAKFNRVC